MYWHRLSCRFVPALPTASVGDSSILLSEGLWVSDITTVRLLLATHMDVCNDFSQLHYGCRNLFSTRTCVAFWALGHLEYDEYRKLAGEFVQ